MSNLYRGPSIDVSYQALVHLAIRFQRKRFKCEKLTDDGCQVMTKVFLSILWLNKWHLPGDAEFEICGTFGVPKIFAIFGMFPPFWLQIVIWNPVDAGKLSCLPWFVTVATVFDGGDITIWWVPWFDEIAWVDIFNADFGELGKEALFVLVVCAPIWLSEGEWHGNDVLEWRIKSVSDLYPSPNASESLGDFDGTEI